MTRLRTLALATAVAAVPLTVMAADHGDVSIAGSNPAADITDLYSWTTDDASQLNLVMGVNMDAGDNAQFSDAVAYIFNINSMSAYGEPQEPAASVVCTFLSGGMIECWAPNDYAVGDPSDENGLSGVNGTFRVFAGLRNDPFFLEYGGFLAAEQAAVAAVVASEVTLDESGCAVLSPDQSSELVGQLQSGPNNEPASDTFDTHNVLALVVQIDTAEVNSGGDILAVTAETRQLQAQ